MISNTSGRVPSCVSADSAIRVSRALQFVLQKDMRLSIEAEPGVLLVALEVIPHCLDIALREYHDLASRELQIHRCSRRNVRVKHQEAGKSENRKDR